MSYNFSHSLEDRPEFFPFFLHLALHFPLNVSAMETLIQSGCNVVGQAVKTDSKGRRLAPEDILLLSLFPSSVVCALHIMYDVSFTLQQFHFFIILKGWQMDDSIVKY